jgi:hypothetical protein
MEDMVISDVRIAGADVIKIACDKCLRGYTFFEKLADIWKTPVSSNPLSSLLPSFQIDFSIEIKAYGSCSSALCFSMKKIF